MISLEDADAIEAISRYILRCCLQASSYSVLTVVFIFQLFTSSEKAGKKESFLIEVTLPVFPIRRKQFFLNFFSFGWEHSFVLDKKTFLHCKKIQFVLKGKR